MRGLKLDFDRIYIRGCCVASFTDAWIETCFYFWNNFILQSHLLQMRGLKLAIEQKWIITSVASFTDAWIETF